MLMRTGVCGVVLCLGLLVTGALAEDPTEEQSEQRGACEEYIDAAMAAFELKNAAKDSASAASSAYAGASKTHLTPGESALCATLSGDASDEYILGLDAAVDAATEHLNGLTEHSAGEVHWAAEEYADACGHYSDAVYLIENYAICGYQAAEYYFDAAAALWGEAKGLVDDALNDDHCILCFNLDAECDCLD